ncbi:MAG: phospholipid carrier-dependent glycosyltransferase [bacterium]|nr:phospholipid carrier-dependent glycosyltransferase [bacterium]
MWHWLKTHPQHLLVAILLFAFCTRIYNLGTPSRYIFDEVYHAVTAKLISRNDPAAYEWWNPAPEPNTAVDWLHPPLAKYTQAASMLAFGENAFGWRFSSAVFGTLVILMTYLLAKSLFKNEALALGAAGLASLDGLLLVQSRIAMNDIHVTFFILLTLWCYLEYRARAFSTKWLVLTGLSAGLAISSKWSGAFVIGIVAVFEGVRLLRQKPLQLSRSLIVQTAFSLFILPVLLYVLSYSHMFIQGKTLVCNEETPIQGECYYERFTWRDNTWFEGYVSHFVELHHQIWYYQTHLEATHGYQSRPGQWLLNLRPVWYHVEYAESGKIANIYAFGNPLLFWFGVVAVIMTILYLLEHLKHRTEAKWPLTFLLASYLAVWTPWQLSPRIMFFYHYTPAVPLLSIILAYWLLRLWNYPHPSKVPKSAAALIAGGIVVTFILWLPHWVGIPVTKAFADQLYFAFSTWK